jgi:hypothetical protein
MFSIAFWKEWRKPYQILWLSLSTVFVISILLTWFYWFKGPASVIQWERIQRQETIETTVHSFRMGPFDLTVPAESYVIFEYLQGGDVIHNFFASYFYLAVLIAAAMVLLTVITTLEGFWYFGAMSLFILFGVSLQLDVLYIFNMGGVLVPAVVITIFSLVSFFFKSLRKQTGFFTRLFTFLLLAALTGIIINFYSTIALPFLHLATTAYVAGMILSILFIITVAHEIMAGFLYIASHGGSKSLNHFLIISVIYLGNLLISCLHIVGYIQWDFIYINAFLLLTISSVLGIWGFRQRENLFENILPFSPFGAYFIVALGVICFATLTQLTGNYNDAPMKVISDMVIFTHMGFGLVFVMYVFSNFMQMMSQDINVHKIMYKPNRMPYFTFRLAGVIVTLAFVFVAYFRDYISNSFAGFYTYAADLYLMQDNEEFATTFYDRSRKNSFQNHRSNYELGILKGSRFDFETADEYYRMANGRNASDFSLVNQGNLYLLTEDYFGAVKTFRANQLKSKSAALSNNLGYTYAKIHNLDSALYFFTEARENKLTKNTAEGNFLAMAAVELIPVKADSLIKYFKSDDPGVIANGMASATLFRQEFNTGIDPLKFTELNLHSATFLNNYIIKNAKTVDTTFTKKALAIASDSLNFDYSEALKSSLAFAFYHQGNVTKAYALLAEIAYLSQSYQGRYNYISGLWSLEQGSPESAQRYFYYANRVKYKNAKLYNAIALTESGSVNQAIEAWETIKTSDDEGEKQMANNIQRILTMTPTEALSASDLQKYQFARYVVNVSDTAYFLRLVNTFQNQNYKGQALLDMSKKQLRADRIVPAIRFFQQISGLELSDKKLYENIQHFELRLLATRKEGMNLAKAINKGITFDNSRFLEKLLYTAIINESSGDSINAEKLYKIVATWNPYFEEGVISAADFYKAKEPNTLKAYDILAEAIQVNTTSLRLLKAYADEASRKGFDDYAASVSERIAEIEKSLND